MEKVTLKFKLGVQGWQSEYNGTLVVPSGSRVFRLSYNYDWSEEEGFYTFAEVKLESIGGYYIAH